MKRNILDLRPDANIVLDVDKIVHLVAVYHSVGGYFNQSFPALVELIERGEHFKNYLR